MTHFLTLTLQPGTGHCHPHRASASHPQAALRRRATTPVAVASMWPGCCTVWAPLCKPGPWQAALRAPSCSSCWRAKACRPWYTNQRRHPRKPVGAGDLHRARIPFLLPGPGRAADWQAGLVLLRTPPPITLPAAPQWVIASGSLPPGVPDDFYAQAARLAKPRAGTWCWTPRARPGRRPAGGRHPRQAQPAAGRNCCSSPWPACQSKARQRSRWCCAAQPTWWRYRWARRRPAGHPPRCVAGPGAECARRHRDNGRGRLLAALVWALAQGEAPPDALRWGVAAGAAACWHRCGIGPARRFSGCLLQSLRRKPWPSLADCRPPLPCAPRGTIAPPF